MTPSSEIALISDRDGVYLAEFLLNESYQVHGIKRRPSFFNTDRMVSSTRIRTRPAASSFCTTATPAGAPKAAWVKLVRTYTNVIDAARRGQGMIMTSCRPLFMPIRIDVVSCGTDRGPLDIKAGIAAAMLWYVRLLGVQTLSAEPACA